MQRSERQLGLRLDAERAENAEVVVQADGRVEERGLADARFSAQDQGGSPTLSRPPQQGLDSLLLCLSADQHPSEGTPLLHSRQRRDYLNSIASWQ